MSGWDNFYRYRTRNRLAAPRFAGELEYSPNAGKTWRHLQNYYTSPKEKYDYLEGCHDQVHPGPPYKTGGPFRKFRIDYDNDVKSDGTYLGPNTASIIYRYNGGFYCGFRPPVSDSLFVMEHYEKEAATGDSPISGNGDIDVYGPTGWKKFNPGKPTADLGVFIGEFRDVPLMLRNTAKAFHGIWKSMGGDFRLWKPKSVANQWLNTQFGWMPFLNDLKKFLRTYSELDESWKRIQKQNGQWVRHGGIVNVVKDSEVYIESGQVSMHRPLLNSCFLQDPSSSGSHTVRRYVDQKVWFEASFRYWIPDIQAPTRKWLTRLQQYGAMPTPSVLWELVPWSWLVDWGSNTGDVIANLNNGFAENLAARYAYIMGTTKIGYKVESRLKTKLNGYIDDEWFFPVVWKKRLPASPFGFGLTPSDLTMRQWSILAALGLTRSRISW